MEENDNGVEIFLQNYNDDVRVISNTLREIIKKMLPEIQEQLDLPTRMIAYSYGNKYSQMICTIIPSKKGVKLGFARGIELLDPWKLLNGSGKITRYIQFNNQQDINTTILKEYLENAYNMFLELNSNVDNSK